MAWPDCKGVPLRKLNPKRKTVGYLHEWLGLVRLLEVLEDVDGAGEGRQVVAALRDEQRRVQKLQHVARFYLHGNQPTMHQHVDQHRQEVCSHKWIQKDELL